MGFFSDFGGSIISGGLGLLGGALSDRSNRKAQKSTDAKNYAMQKEFAQHGIRWKMEDAKRAGLHPMYAMGSTGASAQASFQSPDQSSTGRAVADLGQVGSDIARSAKLDTQQKLQNDLLRAQIDGTQIENTIARRKLTSPTGAGPGIPTAQQLYDMPISERLMSSGAQLQNLEEYPGTFRMSGKQYDTDITKNSPAEHLEDLVGDVVGGTMSLANALDTLPKWLWGDFKDAYYAMQKKYGTKRTRKYPTN